MVAQSCLKKAGSKTQVFDDLLQDAPYQGRLSPKFEFFLRMIKKH